MMQQIFQYLFFIMNLLNEKTACYELAVQRNISCVFDFISRNFADLPKAEATRIQIYWMKEHKLFNRLVMLVVLIR